MRARRLGEQIRIRLGCRLDGPAAFGARGGGDKDGRLCDDVVTASSRAMPEEDQERHSGDARQDIGNFRNPRLAAGEPDGDEPLVLGP